MDKMQLIMTALFMVMVGVVIYCLLREKSEAEDAWAIINELRAEDGTSVRIMCDNDEVEDINYQNGIEVTAEWTLWEPHHFYGRSVLDALKKALQAKGEVK